ncbi:MAG TPA: peptidoglycan-binding domain-containing protein [Kineosporiaceae bacterium]|nr:peptidoglycan-binding domain-containing protein [Kineosporiaceae bacterium]
MNAQVTLSLPILRKGSDEFGPVRRLQTMLNVFVGPAEEGAPTGFIEVDGVFGPATERAVKIFQGADVGDLTVDGIVGPKTWKKLLTAWLSGSEPG